MFNWGRVEVYRTSKTGMEQAVQRLYGLARAGHSVVMGDGAKGSVTSTSEGEVTIRTTGGDRVCRIADQEPSKLWVFAQGTFTSLTRKSHQQAQERLLEARLKESENRMQAFWAEQLAELKGHLAHVPEAEEDDELSSELDMSDEELFGARA